jgi:hypothetical protein
MDIEQAVSVLKQILKDNADGANTRYRMLSEEEVEAICFLVDKK